MRGPGILGGFLMGASLIVSSPSLQAADATAPMTDEQLIASAMTAAPPGVAKAATIVAMEPDGKMRTLRAGTNGCTCMPDSPATPGPDPMCMDRNAWKWVHAWLAHTTPAAGKVGFMYMLAGAGPTPVTPTRTRPARSPVIIGSRPDLTS
jgi:hypothetical protein